MKNTDYTKEAIGAAFEMAEYYQRRCHDAENMLLKISKPFAFYWPTYRWYIVKQYFAKWDRIPLPTLIKSVNKNGDND